ncbi:MAG: acylphosphatase [Chromatiaceae bacterium]|nr:acylphosphatase [Gammaproteobacteria bacterium]MCB1861937.1 acylphosphatase [Gammaproteobacteria bacterium]MCB1873688.1 acylphosphatase [Gammaproteobacteria bacterium]MCP5448622.1 acylphosphatase [Chromatiaceae bacterium]
MMTICVKCLVSGRVQGVFFRASTREQALSLGITGYARNLADGRVEVMACGENSAVSQLRNWLTRGPVAAQVTAVACEPQETLRYQSFTVQ